MNEIFSMDNLIRETISALVHSVDVGMEIDVKNPIEDPKGK